MLVFSVSVIEMEGIVARVAAASGTQKADEGVGTNLAALRDWR